MKKRNARLVEYRKEEGVTIHQGIFYIGIFSFSLFSAVLLVLFVKMFM